MIRRAHLLALVLSALVLALSACGGGDEEPEPAAGGGGGQVLEISADPSGAFKFDTTSLEASAGEVTINMANPSAVEHDVSIEGNGVDVMGEIVGEGGTSTATAELEPGTYTFYCSVPGHREGGMEGTLTVE